MVIYMKLSSKIYLYKDSKKLKKIINEMTNKQKRNFFLFRENGKETFK